MNSLRSGIGFLVGTLLQLSVWKLFGYAHWVIPFLCSPIFSLAGTVTMVGYVGFKESFSVKDDTGNSALSAFWSVLIILQLIGTLICLGVILE